MKITIPAMMALTLLLGSVSHALVSISCGEKENLDKDTLTYSPEVLGMGYGDEEDEKNPAWSLRLNGIDIPNATIENTKHDKVGDVSEVKITMTKAMTPSGPYGRQFVLSRVNSERPRLKAYTMGGFAGKVLIGRYECYLVQD